MSGQGPTRRHALCMAGALGLLPLLAAVRLGRAVAGPAAPTTSTRPPLLLAREWPAQADPAGFLVSEKLDGVRALWDGRQLRFRSGGLIAAPAWFTTALPAEPLDGELWAGRGRFEALVGTVRQQQPDDAAWRGVRLMAFELPAGDGHFSQRAERLARLCAGHDPQVLQALPQAPVAGAAALQRRLDAVVAAGGEGLVLHRADAPVASGRGPWLFKHKPLHDADALVLAHLPGQGRFAGQLGALQVRTDDGQVLAIGTGFSDAQRRQPPAVGTRITFQHRGLTATGVPRFASYLRPAAVL